MPIKYKHLNIVLNIDENIIASSLVWEEGNTMSIFLAYYIMKRNRQVIHVHNLLKTVQRQKGNAVSFRAV